MTTYQKSPLQASLWCSASWAPPKWFLLDRWATMAQPSDSSRLRRDAPGRWKLWWPTLGCLYSERSLHCCMWSLPATFQMDLVLNSGKGSHSGCREHLHQGSHPEIYVLLRCALIFKGKPDCRVRDSSQYHGSTLRWPQISLISNWGQNCFSYWRGWDLRAKFLKVFTCRFRSDAALVHVSLRWKHVFFLLCLGSNTHRSLLYTASK